MDKVSDVSISGVSPQAALQSPQPSPMETAGFSKAKGILDAAAQLQQSKVAASRHAGSPATLPQIERLLEKKTEEPKSKLEKAKSFGGHTLAGGGAGGFTGKAVNLAKEVASKGAKPASSLGARKLELAATMAGAGLGAAEYARKRMAKKKTATIASPAMALKASRQVGTAATSTNAGSSIQGQIRNRLMGRKFVSSSTKTASEQDMKKEAGMSDSGEGLDEMKAIVITREDNKAAAHALFGQSYEEVRKREVELVNKLFMQGPVSQTMAVSLEKQASITPAIDALFEKNAKALGITEAQVRYPELLTVKVAARPAPNLAKRVTTANSDQAPTRSMGTGGAS